MAKPKRLRKFTSESDENLIGIVREYPELYDLSHKKYADSLYRAEVWRIIGEKIKQDPLSCKQRWESLRSQYRKVRRLRKTKSGQASMNTAKWKYEGELQFLHPFMKDKERVTSFVQGASNDSDNDSELQENAPQSLRSSSPSIHNRQDAPMPKISTNASVPIQVLTTTPKTKLKRTSKVATEVPAAGSTPLKFLLEEEKRKQNENKDEIDFFFETMKQTVKKFSAADKHTAKYQIFTIISMLESKYIDPLQVQSHHQIQQFQAHDGNAFLQQSILSHVPPIAPSKGNHNLAYPAANFGTFTSNQDHFPQSSNSSRASTSLTSGHSRPTSAASLDSQDFSPDATLKFE